MKEKLHFLQLSEKSDLYQNHFATFSKMNFQKSKSFDLTLVSILSRTHSIIFFPLSKKRRLIKGTTELTKELAVKGA